MTAKTAMVDARMTRVASFSAFVSSSDRRGEGRAGEVAEAWRREEEGDRSDREEEEGETETA